MVLATNLVAPRLRGSPTRFYLPLVVSIAFLYFLPADYVLSWPFIAVYSLTVAPLPIFFAGIIFSSSLRESRDPSVAFGSNLLGAMVGGFSKYLAMVSGMNALFLLAIVFYLISSLLVRAGNHRGSTLPSRVD
jgi:hypothetical protein